MYIVYGHSFNFPPIIYFNINTLRFYLSVRLCVTDVGVAATNLRFVRKTITCVSAFTEMAIIFLEIVKAEPTSNVHARVDYNSIKCCIT